MLADLGSISCNQKSLANKEISIRVGEWILSSQEKCASSVVPVLEARCMLSAFGLLKLFLQVMILIHHSYIFYFYNFYRMSEFNKLERRKVLIRFLKKIEERKRRRERKGEREIIVTCLNFYFLF